MSRLERAFLPRSIALAATIVLLSLPATSRAGHIIGVFVEKPANTPLAGVELVVRRAADSTVVAHASSAADGSVRLDSLPAGRYLLRASLLGHVPYARADVELTADAPDLDLGTRALAIAPLAIPGVTTTTERSGVILAPDRNIYLAKDTPVATSGTATDLLRTVPELDVDINGNVSLRGSSGVRFQFNGRNAPLKGDALTTYLRQMPASRIERIEVIANPSAKFDPEGTAGIVNLVLKDNASLGTSGSAFLNAGNYWNGPGARVAWQQGPLTFFGGMNGALGNSTYDYDLLRRNLVAYHTGAFAQSSGTTIRSGYGSFDGSFDWALSKRSTLYGTTNGYGYSSDNDALTHVTVTDSVQAVASRWDRTDATAYDYRSTSYTLGFQHVVQQGRNERSIEFLQSDGDNGSRVEEMQATLVPPGVGDLVSRQVDASGDHERSLQADDTHPLGAHGKIEVGYRGARRVTTDTNTLRYASGTVAPAPDAAIDYARRELFHSGYVTLGSTFGRLSVQIGGRGETAHTAFEVRTTTRTYAHDYRSLFPSANLAWDLGRGRSLRLTYSKRIERPSANLLNPEVPTTDSLNRSVGNPDLGPKYTHSWSLDAAWTGSRGTLRLSPYLRETVDNWDQVTTVDSAGVATVTWRNASSVRSLGVSVTASLRQTGRLGGTLGASLQRERHDASNLSGQFLRDATVVSANLNAMFKTTRSLDLQGYLRYTPVQTLAQGTRSAFTFMMLGGRLKLLGEKAWASVWIRDPFNLAKSSQSTGDATYSLSSTGRSSVRGVSATLMWTWGKPPEQKARRQSAETPTPDATTPAR